MTEKDSHNSIPQTPRPDVFSYHDYRDYLRAVYQFRKFRNPRFSYALFGRLLGVTGPHVHRLLEKKRHISESVVKRASEVCELNSWEAEYFVTLALMNQSSDSTIRALYKERLTKLTPTETHRELVVAESKLLNQWFIFGLWELMGLPHFKNDLRWIAEQFSGRVSPDEISEAIKTLESMGLIKIENGVFKRPDTSVMTGRGVFSKDQIIRYHKRSIEEGICALSEVDAQEREFNATSIAIPVSQIPVIKKKLREFHLEIVDYLESLEDTKETVYQFNSQFFPISKRKAK